MEYIVLLYYYIFLDVVPLAGTIILSNRVKKVKLENQKLLPVDTIEEATKRRSELMTKITERLSKKNDINSTKILTKKEIKSPKKIAKKSKKINQLNN